MDYKNYYEILGVAEKAKPEEIKAAYRRLARKYHPDVSKEANAEDKFKEVNEAYEVLKDPEKRAEYDQLKKMGAYAGDGSFRPPPGWQSASNFQGGGFTEADAQHFSDFFNAIFGEAGTAHRTYSSSGQSGLRMRGEDIHTRLALFLEEAYSGCEKQVQFQIPEVDSRGLVSHRVKTLNIKVPAGLSPGQHIRLAGQGSPGIGGGPNGDLFIEIQLAPHPLFTVEGQDIYLTLPITPWEAALGATVTVPSVETKLKLTIPKGAASGQKLRLKGKGLVSGKKRGDQIVVLKLVMPKSRSEEAQTLYERLAELERDFDPRSGMKV